MSELTSVRDFFINMLNNIIDKLPSLFTAILILIVGWFISALIRLLVRKLAERIKLNDIVARAGLSDGLKEAGIKRSSSEILAQLVFWIIFFNFILAAIKTIGLTEAVAPLEAFIGFLPRIFIGLITLIIGALLAQFISKTVQGTVAGMGIEFHQAIGTIVQVMLLGIVIIIIIEQMGLDVTLLTNLFTNIFTIVVGGLALAFGLGGRKVARNVLAGFYARDLFEPGNILIIDGEEGIIEGIGPLNTEIRVGEDKLIVPNTRLTESSIKTREKIEI